MTQTPSMEELLEAGVHFGHQIRRGNPKMQPYIYGAREGVHIMDLAKTEERLKEAVQAAYDLGKSGKVMMIVGTKKQAREIVEELAKQADTPYITSHWIGGLLTNFDEIRKNIKKLSELKEGLEKGQLSRYTKREQLLISRKVKKFEDELGGVAQITQIPEALFLIDTVTELTAVKEAHRTGVILLGFSDTNSDPNWLDYPIPANDDGIKSIKIVTEAVIRAYAEGKKAAGLSVGKAPKSEEKTDHKVEEELDGTVAEEAAEIEEEIEKAELEDAKTSV